MWLDWLSAAILSFTPARKDRAPGTPIRWNGLARFSFSVYTNSENALVFLVEDLVVDVGPEFLNDENAAVDGHVCDPALV
jgi:hypothetical protein